MNEEYIIETEGLSHRYKGVKRRSLDDVNIKIGRNTKTAILGANGAGKSTLFYHFNGVFKPEKGTVMYNGGKIDYSKRGLSDLRSDMVVVLQNPDDQIFSATVEEDIAFGPMNLGLPKEEVEKRVEEALFQVGMSEYRGTPVSRLSFGQRKRVAFAGALAMNPKVLILDEPTAGLDPQMSIELMEMTEQLHCTGTTVIISTHDVDLAYAWADDIHVLRHGKLIYSGDQEGFYSDRVNVYLSGLVPPYVFEINDCLENMNGKSKHPHPRTASQLLGKISGRRGAGTMHLLSVGSPEDILRAKDIDENIHRGIYGTETRKAAYSNGLKAEYVFNALENCIMECVNGADVCLCFDHTLTDKVMSAVNRMSDFGIEIKTVGV
ncbi:MAG: energy-coupling factor ABC transporter ATP-binding protein [Candidatus Methanoplasma sp.]|jgi:cobalt/nickel transport system ATP-binding protein|nr:energy-coupling factor ABC transporter ATP-binding protein [Candidatus Methanoplasma sp.]